MKKNKLYDVFLLSKKYLNVTLTMVLLLGLSESSVRCSDFSISKLTENAIEEITGDPQNQNLGSFQTNVEEVMPLSSLQGKPLLIDNSDALEYFEQSAPSRKDFCNEMKTRYNASAGESLAAWEYFYTQKAIEYERLKRERKKYQHILLQLLPHLKALVEREEANNDAEEQ